MTGNEFYLLLQQKIDKAYSAYIDAGKANRLIRDTIFRVCERVYTGLDTQKEFDEIWSLVIKNETQTVSNPYFDLAGLDRPYMHLFRLKMTFNTLLGDISRTTSSGPPYTTVFTSNHHTVRVGDVVKVGSNTGVVDSITKTTFTTTSTGTLATGPVYLVRGFEAKPRVSDRKINVFHRPSIYQPEYEIANRVSGVNNNRTLQLFPQPSEIEIDYMSEPNETNGQIFTVTTGTITAYSEKFLNRFADECVLNFADQVRDGELRQSAAQAIMVNP